MKSRTFSSRLGRGMTRVLFACGLTIAAGAAEEKFDFGILRDRAQKLAAAPYAPPKGEVPAWLKQLTYDDLRLIEFDGKKSLGYDENLPFQAQFLHPGFLFDKTVHLFQVQNGVATPIPFKRELFKYRTVKSGEVPDSLGFAGFRLMFPFDGPGTPHNEIGSFAGASYYRFLSRDAAYGLSARGLAIDTAEPTPEEFPIFTNFWIEKVDRNAKQIRVYALMESPSTAGAYQFTIIPGKATTVEVKAVVFCRKNPKVFGLAPLTSMFWHGENSDVTRDFRPEVHDSDGLLVHNGQGEWLWRPLINTKQVRVSAFSDENPRAFGLLQRDRNYENYQDLEASYHTRPSTWVEPIGKWGRGSVRLVELPTDRETDDNIVAFWVPETLPAPGQPIEVEYRLRWFLEGFGSPAGYVRSTRHGRSAVYEPGFERFVLDFDGAKLQALKDNPKDPVKVEQIITVGAGATLNHSSLQKNPINGTWRVAFTVKPDGSGKPVELRCFLRRAGESLTETWSYLWQP